MTIWTDEIYQDMEAKYLSTMAEYTEEEQGSMTSEVAAAIAAEYGFALNSFRMKLSNAGKYIKKSATAKTSSATGTTARKSKAGSQEDLVSTFADAGVSDLDMEVIGKLTGKAASYLADQIRKLTK